MNGHAYNLLAILDRFGPQTVERRTANKTAWRPGYVYEVVDVLSDGAHFGESEYAIQTCVDAGWVCRTGDTLSVTPEGEAAYQRRRIERGLA